MLRMILLSMLGVIGVVAYGIISSLAMSLFLIILVGACMGIVLYDLMQTFSIIEKSKKYIKFMWIIVACVFIFVNLGLAMFIASEMYHHKNVRKNNLERTGGGG